MSEPIRVLVVEDSQADALLMVLALEKAGFGVTSRRVETARQMQEALEDEPWDLILSDYRLPHFSGPEALALYRGSGQDIPFLMVSGTIGEELAVECMKAGAHDYVMKGNLARLGPAVRRELQDLENRRMRLEAEASVRASDARYRRIVENAAEGIFTTDSQLKLTFLNRRMSQILERDDLLGRPALELVVEEDRPLTRGWKRPRPGDPPPEPHDVRMLCGDGRSVWVMVTVSPIVEKGKWTGTLGLVTDISERKLLEGRLLQAEREKKWFYREVLRTVTGGKFHLAERLEDVPVPGQMVEEISLDGAAAYARLRERLRELSQGLGMGEDDGADLILAAGEAAGNAIKHAEGGKAQIFLDPGRMGVRILDGGQGILPENLPATILQPGFSTKVSLGMGYSLMLQLSDCMWVATGPWGTLVQLEKATQAPPAEDAALRLLSRFT